MKFTKGEKLVGILFNVGNDSDVAECKKRFAEAIDQLEFHRVNNELNDDKEMIIAEAQKRILDAQMWAVKALTYGK